MAGRHYTSSALPELMTEGPDLAGPILAAERIKSARTQNALAEQELADYPEKKARTEEVWQLSKKGKLMQYENDLLDYFQKSLNSIDANEYPQFRQNMIDKGMGTGYMPETFNTPQEYETWKTKAMERAEDRRQRLNQEFQKEHQERGFTHTEKMQEETNRAAETRHSASEASAERRHQETLKAQKEGRAPIAVQDDETGDDVYVTPEAAIGRKVGKKDRDLKLSPGASIEKERLLKNLDGLNRQLANELDPKRKTEIQTKIDNTNEELKELATGTSTAPAAKPPATSAATPPDQSAKRLAATHAAMYKQGKDPMASPQVKSATERFLRENPKMEVAFLEELKRLYPQGKFDIQKPQTSAIPEQPAAPPNALAQSITPQEQAKVWAENPNVPMPNALYDQTPMAQPLESPEERSKRQTMGASYYTMP